MRRGRSSVAAGEIDAPVYLRSAAKPFIAAAPSKRGCSSVRFRSPRDRRDGGVALRRAVSRRKPLRRSCEKIGMDASALQCGAHLPYDESAADGAASRGRGSRRALHNNCSGKHAGILALCKAIGADTATYSERDNPAQRRILDVLCAPLRRRCRNVAARHRRMRNTRLCDESAQSRALVCAFGVARAACVGQTPRRCASCAMRWWRIRSTWPEPGSSIPCSCGVRRERSSRRLVPRASTASARSTRDAATSRRCSTAARARAGPSTIAALQRLGILDEQQVAELARFARPTVYNRAGRAVGRSASLRTSPSKKRVEIYV